MGKPPEGPSGARSLSVAPGIQPTRGKLSVPRSGRVAKAPSAQRNRLPCQQQQQPSQYRCSQRQQLSASVSEASRYQPSVRQQSRLRRRGVPSERQPRKPGPAGVGLALTPQWQHALQHWEPVSPRLLWARFSGTINTSVVVAYAPTSTYPAARESFFQELDSLVGRIPPRDILLVLGDFNSQVGSASSVADSWGGVLGRHGVGHRTATGEQLLRFCSARRLCISNTFFRHRAA